MNLRERVDRLEASLPVPEKSGASGPALDFAALMEQVEQANAAREAERALSLDEQLRRANEHHAAAVRVAKQPEPAPSTGPDGKPRVRLNFADIRLSLATRKLEQVHAAIELEQRGGSR